MDLEIHRNDSSVRKLFRFTGLALGFFLTALSGSIPVTHTRTGGFTLEGWWVGMTGIAIVLLSSTWRSAFRTAGLLAGLLIFGMAAQLTLISPHALMYFRVRELESPLDFISVAVLIAQAMMVGISVFPHRVILMQTVLRLMTPARILAVGLIFISCAAHVTLLYPEVFEQRWAVRVYLEWLVTAFYFVTVNLLLLWRIAMSVPLSDMRRLKEWLSTCLSLPGAIGETRKYDRIFPWWLAIFVLTVTGFISLKVFDATPHIPDDAAYLFQARTFASGKLWLPAPPVPDAFEFYTLPIENGKWFGVNVPGWPVWLSLGILAGIPWLVNPITAALTIPVAHAAVRRIADNGTAHLAALLLASSPCFLFISASLQPQPVTLFFALLAFLCISRAGESRNYGYALLSGLMSGLIFCIRPLDGALFAGILGLFMLGLGGHRMPLASIIGYGLGCVLTGSMLLLYNFYMTGDWHEFPANVYLDKLWTPGVNRLGFGPEIGRLWGVYDKIPGHGWRDVLLNMNQNLFNLNTESFGWCLGSLFPVTVYLLFSTWSAIDRFFAVFAVILVAGLSLYWFSGGSGYGPRYWYLLILPMIYFGALGCRAAATVLGNSDSGEAATLRISVLVAILIGSSFVVYSSWRAVAKYPNFWWNHDGYRQLLDHGAFGADGLVLIEFSRPSRYASAFYLNDIAPERKGPVFTLYQSPELIPELLAAFPNRSVYQVEEGWSPEEGPSLKVSQLHREDLRLTPLVTWTSGQDLPALSR